jgi:hypothetical protein
MSEPTFESANKFEKKLLTQAGAPVFGREAEKIDPKEMEAITDDPETVEHVTRHLSNLSPESEARLSKEWTNKERGLDVPGLLDAAGSKFDASLNDPYALVAFAKKAAAKHLEQNNVNWIEVEPGFFKADLAIPLSASDKVEIGLPEGKSLGKSGIAALTPELMAVKEVEDRGKTPVDQIKVNVVKGRPLQDIDELVVTLKRAGGKAGLLTMHPGPVAPPLPWKTFPPEAQKAYGDFWEKHTFLKP